MNDEREHKDDEEHKCEDCQSANGFWTICPYNEELYGKEIECCLCASCYNERCMDI